MIVGLVALRYVMVGLNRAVQSVDGTTLSADVAVVMGIARSQASSGMRSTKGKRSE